MDLKEIRQLVGHLESLRSRRLAQQHELGRLILPSRGLFQGEDTESLRESNLFNPAANRALRKAAAGMTQAVTPASNAWFRHAFLLRDDREATGGNEYVNAVDTLLRSVLSAGGFYRAIHAFNKELLGFGCALLGCEESPRTVARYFCQTCGTYCVALDEDGNLDVVARRLLMTPREMARRFGEDSLSAVTRQKLKREAYELIPVRHVVQRRMERDPNRMDRDNMPWGSWWYEENNANDFLHVGGFPFMPFFFTVWEEARGVYGVGPGDEALADQKGVEGWETRKAVGVEKMIDPPLVSQGPLKAYVDASPGAVVPSSGFGADSLKPLYEVNFGPAVRHVQEEINQISLRLEDVMMANIFANMSLETRPAGMTMTEYMDRRRRSAELMGPTVSSYEPRILSPVLESTFALLDEYGLLPQPPDGLSPFASLNVSYQSPMAQMLEQSGAVAIQNLFELAAPMLQVVPELTDKIDFEQAIDELAQRLGVPASVIRSDEMVAAMRRQRAEAQAAQQQQMAEAQMLQQMANLGNVKTQGTVAGEVLGTEQGGESA
ncbi:portal protein [uncultured Desulfovibrio sp.]|uniref:portal protein n=1 Tax=uncultured Desulfovibrio sp. TaxID=167968 RepID=UPI00262B7913|nr:portal protein [uncultured Desulfovibrio sp.]